MIHFHDGPQAPHFVLVHSLEPKMAGQCRHLSYIAEFTGDIQHVASKDNAEWQALCHGLLW
jgi:hypothetical protein